MTESQGHAIPDATAGIDLSLCGKELIHLPGAIQPHGALLAARADGVVTHASANLLTVLGKSTQSVLGRPLAEAVGQAASLALMEVGPNDDAATRRSYLLPGANGRPLHLDACRSGQRTCVDIEPIPFRPWQSQSLSMAESILESFRQATTPDEICSLAVQGFRKITGYDRVIVYRFHPDGNGEVIAEECVAGLEPYLGICYPASDIPPQARQQYLRQRVGMIADSSYQPVPVLSEPSLDSGLPLDLTYSTLRSASPLHRQYMRNMKTAASMTIGLTSGPELWGMLVCHHGQARVLGPDLRAVAGIVGQVMSLLLVSLTEAGRFARQHERQADLRRLVERFDLGMPLANSLAAAEQELLRLVNAAGALVSCEGTLRLLGRTPPAAVAERALATLQLATGNNVLAIDNLGVSYPPLAGCTADGSGALLLPLAQGTNDAILWFRPEQSRTVSWAGNPAEHAIADPVSGEPSPRTSFAIWKETVRGRSAPWEEIDLTMARALRSVVDTEVARRIKSELLSLRQVHLAVDEPNQQRTLELEEFAYAASHDLKAPLRAIEHLAAWISEDLGPQAPLETMENLKLLMGRVERLQFLLGGLLAYSRVGRQTDAVVEDVNISSLIEDIVTQLAPPKGFIIVWPKNQPVIRTYRVLIGVVLTNLIGNAVKHHDRAEGRIEITMRKSGGHAEFRVSDDGPGIPLQFHERIFVVFQTLVSRDDVEASGIGLAIVKKMVLSNGGRIWVESNPPARGSSFVFTWKDSAS